MSSKVDFVLNLPGLNEIMKSGEMQAHLTEASSAVESISGEGFGHRVGIASFTAIGNVFANSKEGAAKAIEENTLIKACHAVGLKVK